MTIVTTKAAAKVAAVATGLAMATSLLALAPMAHAAALTSSQVSSILSLLSSFGADSTTIANVKASLTGSTPVSTGTTATASSCTFKMSLTNGATGSDVTCLQTALIGAGYSIPAGATGYFGNQTKTAVAAWQKANNIAPAVGYFGPISRAAWNLGGGTTTTTTTGTTGGTTTTVATGNGLKVSLSPTSPNGTVFVQGQGIGNLGDFVFSNPTSASINVTGLTFNRIGVSNDTTLTDVYLYNGGTRISDSAGVTNSQFSYGDPSGIFTVPAGGTYTVSVRSDIASSANGQQVGASLVSVSSTGTLDSSVSFPIRSGLQTVSAATLATVNYSTAAIPSGATAISPQNDFPVWQDTIVVSTNPVKLTSMRFTNRGSIRASNLVNLRLYVDGTQIGSTMPTMASDNTVTFDFSSNPYLMSTQSHVVKVLANITGGANRTIVFSIDRSSDGMFVDTELSQPVTPKTLSNTFSTVSTATITINSVSGTSGVSVSRSPSSPTDTVAVGASNVKWAAFDMLASGEDVKVRDLYVFASTGSNNGLDNGKVMFNGLQVGSTKNIGEGTANKTDFSLGSSLILPAGQTVIVSIYADAKTQASVNLANNETVTVSLEAVTNNAQGQSSRNSTTVPTTQISANAITVTSSSLSVTKYSGYGNQTVIVGSNNTQLGSFTLSTGSTEGVTVNTIIVTSSALSSTVTNLTLKDHATGTVLGTIITTPSTSNSFSMNYDIPVSSTRTVDVYGNVLSSANAGSINLSVANLASGTTGTGDITGISAGPASAVALQTITLGSGTLSVTTGANDPVSDNVLAGAANVHVGQFGFTALNTPYTVQNIAVLVPNNAATAVTNVTVSYKDVNGATKTVTQALTTDATKAFATATFTGLTMYVPLNDTSYLDAYVGTPTTAQANGGISGTGIKVTLDDGNGSNLFRAVDSAGSTLTKFNGDNTNIASNGTFYVRKTVPVFAMQTVSSTIPATGNPLYRFSITADPAGAVEWTKLVFNVATTSATVTNAYITNEANGSTNLLDNTTSSASTTKTTITVDLSKNATQPKFEQIGAGATKTYDLYGTVAGFTTGSTITISLASDGAPTANATNVTVAGTSANVVWSDRSTTTGAHSLTSSDWTNGNLLKDFTNNAISYSK